MNYEIELINAIIDSGELDVCIEQHIADVFLQHADIYNFVVKFNSEYGDLPSKEIVKQNFSHFEFIRINSPIQYYIDNARKSCIGHSLRTTLQKAAKATSDGEDPSTIIGYMQSEMSKISRDFGALKDTNVSDYTERAGILKERIANPNDKLLGVTSGIKTMDAMFGGWQPGDFVVVMGWTGVGKSQLTRLFAVNAWKAGYTPLIISLEMDRLQEQYRIDTIMNEGKYFTNSQLVNGRGIDYGIYEEWADETYGGKQPIHLITSDGIDTADEMFVQSKIDQYKPDLVILDYHTLFDVASGVRNETEKAKELSKAFKRIAVRNRVPIIDVAGVTMDGGHEDRPPELSEISWSKQLAYDSDLVLAIHRPPEAQMFQIVTRKTRRCPPFAFYLNWNLESGSWKEVFEHEQF